MLGLKMNTRIRIAALAVPAMLAIGMFGASVHADVFTELGTFTGSGADDAGPSGNGSPGSDNSTVKASIDFQLDSTTDQLIVYLTNTTAASQMYTTHDLLTAVGFNLAGVTLDHPTSGGGGNDGSLVAFTANDGSATGKTVDVSGTTVGTPSPSGTPTTGDLDNAWGGEWVDNGVTKEFGDNYFGLAADILGLTPASSFNGTAIDGNDYAAIPAITSVATADSFNTHTLTYGTVTLAYNINGSTPLPGAFSFS